MKLFGFDITKAEKRSNINDPNFWINTKFGSNSSVTPDSAMQITAVLACVKVISETLASLPLFLYRRIQKDGKDKGKEVAKDHPTFKYFQTLNNINLTQYELREMTASMLCLRGNSYAQIVKSVANKPIEIIPLNPAYMTVEKIGNDIVYRYSDPNTPPRTFFNDEIWHIKDMPDINNYGLVGLSRISQASNAIKLAQGAEDYGKKFFENDTSVGLYLKHPGRLSDPARTNLKSSLDEFKGSKRHSHILLEEGLEVGRIGLSNADSQFIESRHLQIEEIARIFRVPCVLIGYPDKASTYASVEQFMLSFLIHTIRPWCVRIEQSMNKTFLTEAERGEYFWEHKLEGMLRGDMTSRYSAYSIAKSARIMTTNEIRALENLNPLDGEDELDSTPNMIPTDKNQDKNQSKPKEGDDQDDE